MTIAIFLIYFSLALSIIMSLGLIVRSFRFRNVVLALLISELGFFSFFMYLLTSREIYNYPDLFLIQIPVVFNIGPVLYFYVLSLTEDKKKIELSDWIHFSPTFLTLLFVLPFALLYDSAAKIDFIRKMLQYDNYVLLRGILTSMGAVFLPVIYLGISIKRILRSMKRGNPVYRMIMLIFSTILAWFIMGMLGIIATITFNTLIIEIVNYFLCIIILCFYLVSQKYPYLMQFATVPVKKKAYTKSHLDRVDLMSLRQQLRIIMEEEKLFCDEDLSLARLSDALEITQHQLSQFLNTYHQQNFNNFINGYRVNEAKKILLDEPDRQTLSVALAVGFNSYSAFHAAFKKQTGMSPAQFRRRQGIADD